MAKQTAANTKMKRLTIDVTEALHTRIKLASVAQGEIMADMLRRMLQREFPPSRKPVDRMDRG